MSDIRDLISAYADGTATPEERALVERLAAEQPEVAREILWIQVARQMLAEKCRTEAPEELFSTCMSRVREMDRRQRTERTVTRLAPALCGALCVAIIGAGVFNRNQHGNTLGANQVASLMTGGAAVRERHSVDADRAADAFRALNENMGGAVRLGAVPQLQPWSIERGYLDRHPFTRVLFRDSQGATVQLVAVASSGVAMENCETVDCYRISQMNGLTCVAWTEGETTMLLTGPYDQSTLMALGNELRQVRN